MVEEIKPKELPLVYWPNDILHQVSEPVKEFNDKLKQLVADMFYTVRLHDGLGLAAPQVGVNQQIFVLDFNSIKSENKIPPMVFINPWIAELSDDQYECREGCLSVPGHFEKRLRPASIKMKWKDENGEGHAAELQELVAFVALHEYDHLIGKVFVDGATGFKKQRIQKKMQKIIKRI